MLLYGAWGYLFFRLPNKDCRISTMSSIGDVMRSAVSSIENSFTSNPLIDQATTDDEKPTPFYIYQEIIKLTYQGGATCERLLHHLLTKLQSERPSIKLKSLLVMEHLLRKGHPHFQSSLQKEVAKIRPCLGMQCLCFSHIPKTSEDPLILSMVTNPTVL